MNGIVATDGTTLQISGFTIKIDLSTGETTVSGGESLLHYDLCCTWLEIAIDHLKSAKLARKEMLDHIDTAEHDAKFKAMELEFRASMQAMTAAALSIDSFASTIKDRSQSFDKSKAAGLKCSERSKTAAFAIVAETIKVAFRLRHKSFLALRDLVRQLYDFRNQSVHPTGQFRSAVLHPVLGVGVEHRQVLFRYENAFNVVRAVAATVSELVTLGKPQERTVRDYARDLQIRANRIRSKEILDLPPLQLSPTSHSRRNPD